MSCVVFVQPYGQWEGSGSVQSPPDLGNIFHWICRDFLLKYKLEIVVKTHAQFLYCFLLFLLLNQ